MDCVCRSVINNNNVSNKSTIISGTLAYYADRLAYFHAASCMEAASRILQPASDIFGFLYGCDYLHRPHTFEPFRLAENCDPQLAQRSSWTMR